MLENGCRFHCTGFVVCVSGCMSVVVACLLAEDTVRNHADNKL